MRMAPEPVEYYENPSRFESGTLHSSVGAYHDLNRQIDSFYEETQNEAESDREKELQERIDRLEAQLEDEQASPQRMAEDRPAAIDGMQPIAFMAIEPHVSRTFSCAAQ